MPYYRLSVKNGAPALLVKTTSLVGPLIVEASDEITARVIAKTNFWHILRDKKGMPRLECIWTDRTWVECRTLPEFSERTDVGHAHSADGVTCPDFDFQNGRFARLVSWSQEDSDNPDQPGDDPAVLPPERSSRRASNTKRKRPLKRRKQTSQ